MENVKHSPFFVEKEAFLMPKGIMILIPSGSGKTKLGKLLAQKLKIDFIDIDDYIWNFESGIPYTVMYLKQKKSVE